MAERSSIRERGVPRHPKDPVSKLVLWNPFFVVREQRSRFSFPCQLSMKLLPGLLHGSLMKIHVSFSLPAVKDKTKLPSSFASFAQFPGLRLVIILPAPRLTSSARPSVRTRAIRSLARRLHGFCFALTISSQWGTRSEADRQCGACPVLVCEWSHRVLGQEERI